MPATGLNYLDAAKVHFFKIEGAAHLRTEIEDEMCIIETRLRRAFPFSASPQYLSVQDASGKEIGIVSDPSQLDRQSKELMESELDRRYFTPKITAIQSLKNEGGMWTFVVQTQRGNAEFYVRNWRDSAHEIAAGRIQIHSVDGQRFEIASYDALDAKSKTLMEQLF
jgi:hypothetical protein